MDQYESASVLMVCVNDTPPVANDQTCDRRMATPELGDAFSVAGSGREAMELLRMVHFDLVIASSRLPDMSLWELVQSLRSAWPWQKWALVSSDVSAQDEIRARTMGATGVFDSVPGTRVLLELARSIRRRCGPLPAESHDSRAAPAGVRRRQMARTRAPTERHVNPSVS